MRFLWHDVRYGARILYKNPAYTALAVLILALGIGANTAIFSVTNELLLRPRPGIGAPGELVDIGRSQDGSGFDNMSYLNYADYRDRNRSFDSMFGYCLEPKPVSLSSGGGAERIFATIVSGSYFSVLQVKPGLGRLFTQDDDQEPGARAVVVLSHTFWQRRFASNPDIVGSELTLNGHSFTVLGVAPEGFRGTTVIAPDLWVPMMMTPVIIPDSRLLDRRVNVWMIALGRLKPGVTLAQARAEAEALGTQLEREYPEDNRGKGYALYPSSLFPAQMQTYIAAFMALLTAVAAMVLAIVCVNVAGMFLVRASGRQRELAIRLALGAGRGRILRQLLTEGVLLFVLGGLAGTLLAVWLCALLQGLLPELPVPVALTLHMDWRVLLFAIAVSVAAGMLSALAPALHAVKGEIAATLHGGRSGSRRRKLRLRHALVLAQVSVSLLLLICAGLFARALSYALTVDPGFDAAEIQVVALDFSLAGYRDETTLQAADRITERIGALPGVQSTSWSWSLPLDGSSRSLGGVAVRGFKTPGGSEFFGADWNVVTPGYFSTMKIPLLRGRDFSDADRGGSVEVAIINETMAQRFWPGEDPVGREFFAGGGREEKRPLRIIGVARNHKYRTLADEPILFVYVPFRQNARAEMSLLIKTAPGVSILPGARAAIRAASPYLPIVHAQSLRDYTKISLFPQQLAGGVSGSLGLLGLLLTGIGIYGVTAFSVAQRTREIGIRMALGADRGMVVRMVLRQGMAVTMVGLAAGLALAAALAGALSSLMLGVSALDPLTYAAMPALLVLVALLATWIPARRATRIDPMSALRSE